MIFILGIILGMWIALVGLTMMLLHKPRSKELTKEEWKAGLKQR